MNILVVGAAGRTGREVVRQALERGHQVTAFDLKVNSLKPEPNLHLIAGSVLKLSHVEKAVVGQEAVISVLGSKRTERRHIVTDGNRMLITAMDKAGVKRLIVQSAYGAGDSWQFVPWLEKRLIRFWLGGQFDDKNELEPLVRTSRLNWTIIRPAILTDGSISHHLRTGERLNLDWFASVSRADVASFELDIIDEPSTYQKAITICGK